LLFPELSFALPSNFQYPTKPVDAEE